MRNVAAIGVCVLLTFVITMGSPKLLSYTTPSAFNLPVLELDYKPSKYIDHPHEQDSDPTPIRRRLLIPRGGRIARAGSQSDAKALQDLAKSLNRVLRPRDPEIAASALREGTHVITQDQKFFKFLRHANSCNRVPITGDPAGWITSLPGTTTQKSWVSFIGGWGNGGSHAEHRRGINCDVRCCTNPGNVPQARWVQLTQIFRNQGSTDTNDETQTNAPHWHLRFLFGNQNQAINRNAGHFVAETFSSALERESDSDEWQDRMDTFDAAHLQGQTQTIDAARAMTAALFYSVEYASRNRTDQEFVDDLYQAFLLRQPDTSSYTHWLGVLQSDNNNGLNGRAHLIQAFVESPEFRNLIVALTDTPAARPFCNDPPAELSCYSQGGIWDSNDCSCIVEPDPDPCLQKPSLCDIYPIY